MALLPLPVLRLLACSLVKQTVASGTKYEPPEAGDVSCDARIEEIDLLVYQYLGQVSASLAGTHRGLAMLARAGLIACLRSLAAAPI